MLHFPFLEQHDVVACMSERGDGDGSTREGCEVIYNDDTKLSLVSQVHGSTLVEASQDSCTADGIVVTIDSPAAGIRVADCVPVWIVAPKQRVGTLVHAGREGTVQGIAGYAVERLCSDYAPNPADLIALIGPSAGPCCYEVSPEMAEEFENVGGIRSGRHLDLWKTNANQLLKSGIPDTAIEISGLCTICCGRFHSYRAHKTTARNLCVLQIQ